ncbi:xylogen-like protein 11 [Canna indica]|uniref:Xylogen-like protein 11 n=1 Tax=Canna indica TaxID=4628 RepID=A0AAQ3KXW3_9LILI|nr:xylogen-like protein 11 [Canna indica]
MAAKSSSSAILAIVVVAAALAMQLHGGAGAEAPAPSAGGGLDCTQSFLNMSGCLSYVSVGSNDTAPDKDCCGELAGIFDSNPICLCELLDGGAERFGIAIDYDKALKLPSSCHVDSLPVSMCSEIGIPVPSPTMTSPSPSGMMISASPSPSASGPQKPGMTPESPPSGGSAAAAGFGAADLLAIAGLSIVIGIF